jgi:hypothetical protein
MKKFEKEFFELLRTPEKDRALLVRRDQALCGLIARFEMQDRDKVLRYAEAGDWTPLADYVRKGGRVTIQMRPFLADVLDGKRKRPAKKISAAETERRNLDLAAFVGNARDRGEKDIARRAEEKFGRTWRNLQKILASLKKDPNAALFLTPSPHGRIRKTVCLEWPHPANQWVRERGPGVTRYYLSDMALTPHTLP